MTRSCNDTEAAVVALISGHDPGAPEAVYRAYAGYLTGVCTRYLSDTCAVKDTLHDSFLKIFTALQSFEYRGAGSLKAWLTRIVVNEALKTLRRNYNISCLETLPDDIAETDIEPQLDGIPADALHEMIRALPPPYRTVLNLYVFECRSHRDIARILNIKESSSASRFHRAKAMLARSIREYQSKHNR
ncbi:MAG: sigma-70 family RNA polymerase sigma factor [Duncaniella sp.]|nr:sigma-70 family RNA polymerase sigma factor [Duncaniella sp.]